MTYVFVYSSLPTAERKDGDFKDPNGLEQIAKHLVLQYLQQENPGGVLEDYYSGQLEGTVELQNINRETLKRMSDQNVRLLNERSIYHNFIKGGSEYNAVLNSLYNKHSDTSNFSFSAEGIVFAAFYFNNKPSTRQIYDLDAIFGYLGMTRLDPVYIAV